MARVPNNKDTIFDYHDDTPMPWGKHKGTPLGDVPAEYLLWLHSWNRFVYTGAYVPLRNYIDACKDILEQEAGVPCTHSKRRVEEERIVCATCGVVLHNLTPC